MLKSTLFFKITENIDQSIIKNKFTIGSNFCKNFALTVCQHIFTTQKYTKIKANFLLLFMPSIVCNLKLTFLTKRIA